MAYNPKGGEKNFLIEFTNVTNEREIMLFDLLRTHLILT